VCGEKKRGGETENKGDECDKTQRKGRGLSFAEKSMVARFPVGKKKEGKDP